MNWKKYIITRLPVLSVLIGAAFMTDFSYEWLYFLGIYTLFLFDFSTALRGEKIRIESLAKNISVSTLFAGGFVGLLTLLQKALFSNDIFDINAIAVQYSWRGLIYILMTIIGLYSLFAISIKIRKNITLDLYKSLGILLSSSAMFGMAYWLTPIFQGLTFAFYIVFLLLLDWFVDRRLGSLVYNFVWVFFLSAFSAIFIFGLTIEKDKVDRQYLLSQIYHDHSPQNDLKVLELNDKLIQSEAFQALSQLPLQAKMNKEDYAAFVRKKLGIKGEVVCEAYANDGEGIFSEQYISLSEQLNMLNNSEAIKNHIYFNPLKNRYKLYFKINNEARENPIHLFVTLGQKQELPSLPIEYIVFKNKRNIASNVEGTIPLSIETLQDVETSQLRGNYAYVVEQPAENVNILSFRNIAGLNRPLSLFSFILAVSGLVFLFLVFVERFFHIYPDELSIDETYKTSLRSKIQLMVISLIIFSFMIIGIVTTYHFQNLLTKNRLEQQQEEITTILKHISTLVDGADNNQDALFTLENKLEQIENIYNKSMMVFDQKGIFTSGNIVGKGYKMTPAEIHESHQGLDINLALGNENWKSVAVYAKGKQPFAYLAVANDGINDSGNILDFLSTILNIFVFLFMTAGALAIFMSNSITRPIAFLGERFKQFKLGKTTEQLEWQSNDEIGALINEYNKLTIKVQESAEIIAKTQREVAWREMAKQVAHEIKNPLTPMKLSIQYLQHQLKTNPERGPELIAKTSKTLEEQINNLTQIANEFSNFAAMPKADNQEVILNEIVEAVHDLFRKRGDLDIHLSVPIDDVKVFADHNHIVRILNNIVKNAIQAIPDDRRGKIDMSLYGDNGLAIIKVEDNGKGIPDHMKEKIFEPNFTTKSSGTGLGLAISANMIESFNGKLYFESEENIGTIFYIEIPLMKSEVNLDTI